MKIKTLAVSVLLASQIGSVFASERIGRYTSIEPGPTPVQLNLLSSEVKMTFPRQIETIEQALDLLLRESGYRLSGHQDPYIDYLLKQELPMVHRDIGPISLLEAVEVMAGNQWHVSTNPVTRTISFTLRDAYRAYVETAYQRTTDGIFNLVQRDEHASEFSCLTPHVVHSLIPIYYAPSSHSLDYRDLQKIELVVNELKSHQDLAFKIRSYTDQTGSESDHIPMSRARAEVVSVVFEEHGLSERMLSIQALGATYPNQDLPIRLQRVTEIEVIKCAEPIKTWAAQKGMLVEDLLDEWVNRSGVYERFKYSVVDNNGQSASIRVQARKVYNGSVNDAIYQLLTDLRRTGLFINIQAQADSTLNKLTVTGVVK
ncbi:MAG: OmpA family protein [Methyloprofundus sp.]|nr:OmpA family protein [Methyloprofundus sp.]